jgi:predicted negative regulator of RcsB-dependent stress response
MESDVTQSALFLKLWAWADKNRKQLLWGVVALAAVALGVAFWMAHQNEVQNTANEALSKLLIRGLSPTAPEPSPNDLLKLAADYPGTDAAQRAELLGAAGLFTSGKYDEAEGYFRKFLQEHADSPLIAQATFGIAACLDAQGKTNDAMSAYKGITERYSTQNVAPQAQLALARLSLAQGKLREAKSLFEEAARTAPGTLNAEARLSLEELNIAHPELTATNQVISTNQIEQAIRSSILKK